MIGFPKNFTDISDCIHKRQSQGFISKNQTEAFLKQGNLYLQKGLPHHKTEGWKHFPFTRIDKLNYIFSEDKEAPVQTYPSLNKEGMVTLRVINGKLQTPVETQGFSVFHWKDILSDKVKLDSEIKQRINQALTKDRNSLCYLNNALSLNGLILVVEENLKKPLDIQYIHSLDEEGYRGLNLRSFIFVRKGCKAQVLESFYGSKHSAKNKNLLVNLQTDGFLESYSSLHYVRLDQGEDKDVQFNQFFGHLEAHSKIYSVTLSLNSEVNRYLTEISQKEHSESCVKGLSILNNKKYTNHKVSISHLAESSKSSQWYQSLLFHSAQHIFNGKIHIAREAQKTDAQQLNKNYLLGDKAYAVSCPELQVLADDVKASHGAFISSLEENRDMFFYLQARGLSKLQALNLILSSLVKEAFSVLDENFLKTYLENKAFAQLQFIMKDTT